MGYYVYSKILKQNYLQIQTLTEVPVIIKTFFLTSNL